MNVPIDDWRNKAGTADRACSCGSWKDHWLKFSGKPWPLHCSKDGCSGSADVGAHIVNPALGKHEYIAPLCLGCNSHLSALPHIFSLRGGITLVPANKAETCDKP